MPCVIDDAEYLLAHGASRFLKAEKVQDLKRKGKTGASLTFGCLSGVTGTCVKLIKLIIEDSKHSISKTKISFVTRFGN